jgi:diguanylate cyclase (GGDEF)-like protein
MSHAPRSSGSRFVRKYFAWIFLVVALGVLAVFWGFERKATSMLHEQILAQGKAFFSEIVMNREWVAAHGGVYVRMTPGMEVNPWLLTIPGLKTVIRDEEGVTYTLKHPALVTREISELAEKKGLFRFRITSLKPLNPSNVADPFETASLEKFEKGDNEAHDYETSGSKVFFRYMAPLVAEKACLRCHEAQGYKEGDVRGGISVTIDATPMLGEMATYRTYLTVSAIGIVAMLLAITLLISRFLIIDLKRAELRLVELATLDPLTGLLNRREGFRQLGEERARATRTGRPLTAVMIDIDHFKRINDTHGHAAGDAVLQEVGRRMQAELREYDLLCRYGGEEFLVVTPETEIGQACVLAERLRASVQRSQFPVREGVALSVTISLGVAEFTSEETVDQVISRADSALYAAKDEGRNRVRTG